MTNTTAMSFHPFSKLKDSNPIKLILLEHILAYPKGLLDPDGTEIMHADFNFTAPRWTRKGIPWLEGHDARGQACFQTHVRNVLSVNRYFHVEGLKIVLRNLEVTFTFAAGLGSGLRYLNHVRWALDLQFGSMEGRWLMERLLGLLDLSGFSLGRHWPTEQFDKTRRLLAPRSFTTTPTLAFNNLSKVEIHWVCRRYEPIVGDNGEREWKPCVSEDLQRILRFLEIQLLAYPRVKKLTIDFIGWDYTTLISPFGRHQTKPIAPRHHGLLSDDVIWGLEIKQHDNILDNRAHRISPSSSGLLDEIVIRGLEGEQQEKVSRLVSHFVRTNGRVGTTSSHFMLVDRGTLMEVHCQDPVVWETIEGPHPFLDWAPALEDLMIRESGGDDNASNVNENEAVGDVGKEDGDNIWNISHQTLLSPVINDAGFKSS